MPKVMKGGAIQPEAEAKRRRITRKTPPQNLSHTYAHARGATVLEAGQVGRQGEAEVCEEGEGGGQGSRGVHDDVTSVYVCNETAQHIVYRHGTLTFCVRCAAVVGWGNCAKRLRTTCPGPPGPGSSREYQRDLLRRGLHYLTRQPLEGIATRVRWA